MRLLDLAREGAALKASAGEPRFWATAPGAVTTGLRQLTLGTNWARAGGDPWLNGVVLPCLAFKANAVREVTPLLERWDDRDRKWVAADGIKERAWLDAFESPNDDYGWRTMLAGVLLGVDCAGNGFLLKRRDNLGRTRGYRWEPSHLVRPTTKGTESLIDGYEYGVPGGTTIDLAKDDVVQIRAALMDPRDRRLGLSPLSAAVRDLVADNELSAWLAALLLNGGAPEWLFVPKADAGAGWTPEKAAQFRDYWNSFRRENRGGAMNAPAPIDTVRLSHSPADLQLDQTRQGPASRICAALGTDPMVIGLPSSSKTYSNYAEALDSFGKQTVLPMLGSWGEQIGHQTLEDFGLDRRRWRVAWDTSNVTWLQDETDKTHARIRDDFKAGVIDLYRAKELLGETPEPGDRGTTYFALVGSSRPTAPTSEPSVAKSLLLRLKEDRLVRNL